MNLYRTAVKILASILVLLSVTSCLDSQNMQSSEADAVSFTEQQDGPLPNYALVTKEANNPYMVNMFEGFKAACEEIGVNAVLRGPSSYTVEEQIKLVEELIEEDVAVIAIAANHADALEETLVRAMDAGISVLSLDSSVNPESRIVHIQQADPEKVGRVLVQAAYKMVDGQGKAAIISSTPHATNQNLWLHWMLKESEENTEKYGDFISLPVRYGEDSLEKTKEVTMALLEEEPELSIIITPSVVSMMAVGQVIAEQESDVRFTGLGLPSEMAEYILDGNSPWMYLWNPNDLGYLAAYAGYAIDAGTITGKIDESFSAGRLGLRSISPAADGGTEVLLGDPMKFDADNIRQWQSVY